MKCNIRYLSCSLSGWLVVWQCYFSRGYWVHGHWLVMKTYYRLNYYQMNDGFSAGLFLKADAIKLLINMLISPFQLLLARRTCTWYLQQTHMFRFNCHYVIHYHVVFLYFNACPPYCLQGYIPFGSLANAANLLETFIQDPFPKSCWP